MSTAMTPNDIIASARSVLESHVECGYASGVVALIGRRGDSQVLTIGVKSLGATDAMQRNTIFRIASMTKPITAAAAMMLIEDGKLRLDEPVDRLLPELAERRVLKRIDASLDETVAAKRQITVEDLLTFRLGWGMVLTPHVYPIQRRIRELGLMGFGRPDPTAPYNPDEWIGRLGSLPLMSQPGESWLYTTGSNVLGVLIARASGQTLNAFLRERIFGPLRMDDTAFYVPVEKRDRLADEYVRKAGKLELSDAAVSSRWGAPPAFPAGDAGLVSTIEDFFAFSEFLMRPGRCGGRQILAESSVAAMTTDHLTPAQRVQGQPILSSGRGWGYGMSVVLNAEAEGVPASAYGWNGGLGTSWVADPGSGLTAILMTQTMFESPDPPIVHKDFWRSVFGR
jgi:CubicO group peptidase (beta-lactamase class C family)